jgi:hypothetical protein
LAIYTLLIGVFVEAEQRLIEYTIQYECQLLEQAILHIKLLSGFDLPTSKEMQIEWSEIVVVRLFQILLIPFMLILVIVILSFVNSHSVFEQWQIKHKLKKELQALKKRSAPYQSPTEKNIVELWRIYGLDSRFGREQQLHLIERWVELLYGHKVLKRLKPKVLLAKIRREHALANKAYSKGNKTAPYFFFNQDDISLTRKIAKILPAYDTV